LDEKKAYAIVFMIFSFLSMIYFNELFTFQINQNEIDYKYWDNNTVTLNDFTVELRIDRETWDEFKKKDAEPRLYLDNKIPKLGERFTEFLKEKIYQ
jgi:hypothetical protein